ncbi:carbon-nitrogen hydrolase family protein [Cohnella hongkongensis]|uniref:Carbon-nitrogen hydrolase family protein n=1 Tax=Cohnella hongkongensis TaxID=178337 RepID=A0ABV9F938_9BACL
MTKLTVAAAQYGLTDIRNEEQFWTRLADKTRDAAERGAELIVFPEYTTTHLLSLEPPMSHEEACAYLDRRTGEYMRFFGALSRETGIAILAGTHVCKGNGEKEGAGLSDLDGEGAGAGAGEVMDDGPRGFVNRAFLFFPDGRVEGQSKIHLTPEEQRHWPLAPGTGLNVFDTPWGKTAILICYDVEFPELARAAALQGAETILCPSYTDSAFGYYRVRHCSQARAVENQLFVVLSGLVGALSEERPQVDAGYSQAGAFAPCDYPFVPDGVLAAGETNVDASVIAELDYDLLRENRTRGGVAPFYDRKPDVYERELSKGGL